MVVVNAERSLESLDLLPLRSSIVGAVPLCLRRALAARSGLFFAALSMIFGF